MKIKIKYNGKRYPRAVIMRNGTRVSFLARRLVLDLDEYDALYLLKGNSRLKPLQWEFTVVGIEEETHLPEPKVEPKPIEKEPIVEPVNIPPAEKKPEIKKKVKKVVKKKGVAKMAT